MLHMTRQEAMTLGDRIVITEGWLCSASGTPQKCLIGRLISLLLVSLACLKISLMRILFRQWVPCRDRKHVILNFSWDGKSVSTILGCCASDRCHCRHIRPRANLTEPNGVGAFKGNLEVNGLWALLCIFCSYWWRQFLCPLFQQLDLQSKISKLVMKCGLNLNNACSSLW